MAKWTINDVRKVLVEVRRIGMEAHDAKNAELGDNLLFVSECLNGVCDALEKQAEASDKLLASLTSINESRLDERMNREPVQG